MNATFVYQYLTKVNPGPELDSLILRAGFVLIACDLMQFDPEFYCAGGSFEQGQNPVPTYLNHSAVVLCARCLKQRNQCFQFIIGIQLILAHEPGVSYDISEQYCAKPLSNWNVRNCRTHKCYSFFGFVADP
ncbi:hypothetical protein RUM4293_03860 [Ruegeria atlantica]|uniref:Uncharacterized protein n=1 Tax=Ruegeria atlantica TaxID=81569 RepID=A0A0P1E9J7_9RHOB|nr:hypothetical protein RUM4293_03860 [Ruegeria atlantica]